MALWEISFQIVDRNKKYLQGDELMYAWKISDISKSALDSVEKEFGVSKSWHADIKMIGSEDDVLIKLSRINDEFSEISCRYNVIQSSSKKTIQLLEFMKKINSVIFYDNSFYEPEYEDFVDLIKNSDAANFILNQEKYLDTKKK